MGVEVALQCPSGIPSVAVRVEGVEYAPLVSLSGVLDGACNIVYPFYGIRLSTIPMLAILMIDVFPPGKTGLPGPYRRASIAFDDLRDLDDDVWTEIPTLLMEQ